MATVFVSYQRADTLLLAHCSAMRCVRPATSRSSTPDRPGRRGICAGIDEWLPARTGARADRAVVRLRRMRKPNSVVAFEWRRARFHGCAVLPVLYQTRLIAPADRLPAECGGCPR